MRRKRRRKRRRQGGHHPCSLQPNMQPPAAAPRIPEREDSWISIISCFWRTFFLQTLDQLKEQQVEPPPPPPPAEGPPPSSLPMKRPCEDSSSAGSLGLERFHPGHSEASPSRCGSPTTSPQATARRRRGIIEKRRRDRINSSLMELRLLLPTAWEKQGSAKLEKAELLQMTVDHLKMLQAAGGKGPLDARALAMDFLSVGFRECVAEVSCYLSTAEALDSSDPLRCRLLSHLSSCASHRLQPQRLLPPHWAVAAPPYRLSALPDGGAPQRLVEQHLLTSTPLSASIFSFPFLPPASGTFSSSRTGPGSNSFSL